MASAQPKESSAPASSSSAPPATAVASQSTKSDSKELDGGKQGGEAPAPPADAAKEADKAPADDEAAGEEDVEIAPASTGSVVDMEVFGQLLEIDDDESHEFSKTLAFDYITQADATFIEIEEALAQKDLDALSRKGHFLKGSSAALGLQRVQHSCEAMQNYGKRKDAKGDGDVVDEALALGRCRALLKRLKTEQQEAKEWLEAFYKV
ncbi:hypothetical protein JCM10207_003751 [Rhodosporidiobolus poonsookiae]